MKAHELIELLAQYDPDTEILVQGYEGGYSPISSVCGCQVQQLDRHGDADFYGRYEPLPEALRQLALNADSPELAICKLAPPTAVGNPVAAIVLFRE